MNRREALQTCLGLPIVAVDSEQNDGQCQRRRGVEKSLLRGHRNLFELAAAHGVSPLTIVEDIKSIRRVEQ